ncbi:MAG: helix-turn-helix domain-containing protein [Lachnospiraceae bacterium]
MQTCQKSIFNVNFTCIITNKPLSEIASLLTFANQSHFQRSFKKHYNITPLQYRKKSLGTSIPNQYPQT